MCEYPINFFYVSLSFIDINWPNFDLPLISTISTFIVISVEMHVENRPSFYINYFNVGYR